MGRKKDLNLSGYALEKIASERGRIAFYFDDPEHTRLDFMQQFEVVFEGQATCFNDPEDRTKEWELDYLESLVGLIVTHSESRSDGSLLVEFHDGRALRVRWEMMDAWCTVTKSAAASIEDWSKPRDGSSAL